MNLLDGFSTTQQPMAPSSQDSENQESSHTFEAHTHTHTHITTTDQRQPQPVGLHSGLRYQNSVVSHKGWAGLAPQEGLTQWANSRGRGRRQGFGAILWQILACSFAKRTAIPSRIVLKFEKRVAHTAWQIVSLQKRISLSSCSIDHQKLHIYHLIA